MSVSTFARSLIASSPIHFWYFNVLFYIDFGVQLVQRSNMGRPRAHDSVSSMFASERMSSLFAIVPSFAFSLVSQYFCLREFLYSSVLAARNPSGFSSAAKLKTFTILCIVYFKYVVECFVFDYGNVFSFIRHFRRFHRRSLRFVVRLASAVASHRSDSNNT